MSAAVSARLSPERTRRATLFERYTVGYLGTVGLARLNRWLEFAGKLATVVWVLFLASVALGADWRQTVESVLNAGRPVEGVIVVVVAAATFLFVTAHSSIGWARWKLQRELWRRDVERLRGTA